MKISDIAGSRRVLINAWIVKRGETVHRSRPVPNGIPAAHLARKDELEKAVRFFKDLVEATDDFIDN